MHLIWRKNSWNNLLNCNFIFLWFIRKFVNLNAATLFDLTEKFVKVNTATWLEKIIFVPHIFSQFWKISVKTISLVKSLLYLRRSDKIQFLNSNHRNWTLYSVGRLWCLKWNDCPIYTMGQKSGQIASVVDFLTYIVGQKSGLKASVVDFWTYSVGQKSGQKPSVVD